MRRSQCATEQIYSSTHTSIRTGQRRAVNVAPKQALGEGSKADKPDARKLAELLRAGLLRLVYYGHEATRHVHQLTGNRVLVEVRRSCHLRIVEQNESPRTP